MRTSSTSQVRFHDQVRVKKTKPYDESEDYSLLDETVGEAEGDDNDMEWSDEDEKMENGEEEEDSEEDSEEGEEEEEEENDDENEANPKLGSRQAIERLKHDLFAEEEEEVQDGRCHLIHRHF